MLVLLLVGLAGVRERPQAPENSFRNMKRERAYGAYDVFVKVEFPDCNGV